MVITCCALALFVVVRDERGDPCRGRIYWRCGYNQSFDWSYSDQVARGLQGRSHPVCYERDIFVFPFFSISFHIMMTSAAQCSHECVVCHSEQNEAEDAHIYGCKMILDGFPVDKIHEVSP